MGKHIKSSVNNVKNWKGVKMFQQNYNGITLTWFKRTLFKWDSPAHAPHQPPACKVSPFSIHMPHGNNSETGAITGTRGICESLGATVRMDPLWAMSVQQQALLPRTLTHAWYDACKQSSKLNFSAHLLHNHTELSYYWREKENSASCPTGTAGRGPTEYLTIRFYISL